MAGNSRQEEGPHNQLANFILSLGDDVYAKNMNFTALAKKAKKTKLNSKGKLSVRSGSANRSSAGRRRCCSVLSTGSLNTRAKNCIKSTPG